jgi:hypothetical protein
MLATHAKTSRDRSILLVQSLPEQDQATRPQKLWNPISIGLSATTRLQPCIRLCAPEFETRRSLIKFRGIQGILLPCPTPGWVAVPPSFFCFECARAKIRGLRGGRSGEEGLGKFLEGMGPLGSGSAGTKAYIYAVAGRNRGLTLGTCERMSIETGEWEWCPMLKVHHSLLPFPQNDRSNPFSPRPASSHSRHCHQTTALP